MSEMEDMMNEFAQEATEELPDENEGRKMAQEELKQYHAKPVEEKPQYDMKKVFDRFDKLSKSNEELRKELQEVKKNAELAKYYSENHERRNITHDVSKEEEDILSKPELAKYYKKEEIF